jgi:hypothetical protein
MVIRRSASPLSQRGKQDTNTPSLRGVDDGAAQGRRMRAESEPTSRGVNGTRDLDIGPIVEPFRDFGPRAILGTREAQARDRVARCAAVDRLAVNMASPLSSTV